MSIKTINVPFFGNAEHSANGGSVNSPDVDRPRKAGQGYKSQKPTLKQRTKRIKRRIKSNESIIDVR